MRNPKTVMKEAAALRAQLTAERELRGKVSDALGEMLDQAERLGKQVEYYQDQRRGGGSR